jgi:hypothetical protein
MFAKSEQKLFILRGSSDAAVMSGVFCALLAEKLYGGGFI